MDRFLHFLRVVSRGVAVSVLPSPERQRMAREHGLDAPRWSLALGLVQGGAGVALFVVGGLAFARGVSADLSMAMLDQWQPGLTSTDLRATGLLGWLAWLVYPASWPYSYLGVVGLSRCLAFAITREAFGEPLVTLGLRTYQSVARRRRDRRREAELGPMRSDRLLRDGERLVVVSCRPKEGWDETATVEIDGLYYRVDAIEDRREGEWTSVAYRLRKADAGELIRRLVRYSAPSGTLQAAGGSRRASPTAD